MYEISTRVGTILSGIASGLIPMAIFTPIYAIWPAFAWPIPGSAFFALAAAWAAYLLVSAIRLIRMARELPRETNSYDARISRGMAIVSSIQGVLILTTLAALVLLGLYVWILPAVTLIVALHFFPMPAIFGRTIDYYLGSVMLLVSIVGLTLAAQPDIDWIITWGVTGTGAALVTSAYGAYMIRARVITLGRYEEALA